MGDGYLPVDAYVRPRKFSDFQGIALGFKF